MLKYNLEIFKSLLKDVGILTQAGITFFDENFVSTSAHSGTLSTQSICSHIKKLYGSGCGKSDTSAFQALQNGDSAIHYFCHFGFIEMAFKVAFDNVTHGYIIVGPFRDPAKQKENVQTIKELCEKTGYDTDKMILEYKRISKFSLEKFEALRNILSNLLQYAKSNSIIYSEQNLFSTIIEPYISEHLSEELNIERLCSQFFLTTKQLYAIFETSSNTTPKKYIAMKRIQQAKHLILSTDLPLSEISTKVGVDDYNYFIKIFKKYTGFTPMYYRKSK